MSRRQSSSTAVEQHFSPGDVAKCLGVHPETVLRRVRSGGFPRAIFLGRMWRIPASDVNQWLSELRPHQQR